MTATKFKTHSIKGLSLALLTLGLLTNGANGASYGVDIERSNKVALDVELLPVSAEGKARSVLQRSASNIVKAGDTVHVCFKPGESGYISVWDVDNAGNFTRILPNKWSENGTLGHGVPVAGNTKTCGGENGSGYAFHVAPPAGKSQLYVHWSKKEADQVRPEDYVVIGRSAARAAGVPVLGDGYSSYYLEYEVQLK